jgi:prohibitin 2
MFHRTQGFVLFLVVDSLINSFTDSFYPEQNNLKAIQVIANQTVVQAQATARANVAKANGESQAIKIITVQLKQSPTYLQWLAINRWNGQMPYALGSSVGSSTGSSSFGGFPFFQLPTTPLQQQLQPTQQQTAKQNLTKQ